MSTQGSRLEGRLRPWVKVAPVPLGLLTRAPKSQNGSLAVTPGRTLLSYQQSTDLNSSAKGVSFVPLKARGWGWDTELAGRKKPQHHDSAALPPKS